MQLDVFFVCILIVRDYVFFKLFRARFERILIIILFQSQIIFPKPS